VVCWTGVGSEGHAVAACSFFRALLIRRARSGLAGSTCEANQRAADRSGEGSTNSAPA
jgi:hypothetical protein